MRENLCWMVNLLYLMPTHLDTLLGSPLHCLFLLPHTNFMLFLLLNSFVNLFLLDAKIFSFYELVHPLFFCVKIFVVYKKESSYFEFLFRPINFKYLWIILSIRPIFLTPSLFFMSGPSSFWPIFCKKYQST